MKTTQNYGLKKPEGTDTVNIDDFNSNADVIDTTLLSISAKADQAFQSASNGKGLVANAITGKGVSASGSDTFQQLATKISSINVGITPDGNAGESQVLSGLTFYGSGTAKRTGTMANNGAVAITPSTSNQTIATGYHNGSGYVKGDSNLATANIKAGISVFGVNGKTSVVDTADATATAANILNTKTAYINGSKVVGTMTNNNGVTGLAPWSFAGASGYVDVIPPAGYYDNGASVRVPDANLVAANILNGKSIFGVAGNATKINIASGTATPVGSYVSFTGENGDSVPVMGGTITVTGLTFKPRIIILQDTISGNNRVEQTIWHDVILDGIYGSVARSVTFGESGKQEYNGYTYAIKADVSPAYVNSTGFALPSPGTHVANWYAIGW